MLFSFFFPTPLEKTPNRLGITVMVTGGKSLLTVFKPFETRKGDMIFFSREVGVVNSVKFPCV
jgi:hypothetical protein